MRSIAPIFTGCALLFAGTAQAAVTPYVAITSSALSPHAGSPFVLTASSTGEASATRGTSTATARSTTPPARQATATLPEGNPTVGVRATDASGRAATETRTMVVHAFNVQPVPTLTLGASVPRVGVPFDVTASGVDADGTVTEIELDLDGDGTYEVASCTCRTTIVVKLGQGPRPQADDHDLHPGRQARVEDDRARALAALTSLSRQMSGRN